MPVPNHNDPKPSPKRRQSDRRRAALSGLIMRLVEETGANRTEVRGLTLGDIDEIKRCVQLRDARTGRRRTVQISQELADALAGFKAVRRYVCRTPLEIRREALVELTQTDLAGLFGLIGKPPSNWTDIAGRQRRPASTEPMPSWNRAGVPDLQATAGHCRRRPYQASALGLAAWIQEETGGRLSEIAGLRLEDLDVARQRIRLQACEKRGARSVSISFRLAMVLFWHFTVGCLQEADELGDELARLNSPTVRRAFAHGRYRFLRQVTECHYR